MSWTKLGDELPAAARDLSDSAFRTHVEALCWSNSRLLDLMIPKHEVRRFAETSDPVSAVEELVAAGWWQDCEDAGWYVGCRFAEWQLERAVVDHRRALAAERQRRKRLHASGDHSLCTASCSVTRDNPRDGERDDPRDPGRDGSGRDGNDNYGLEEKEQGHQLDVDGAVDRGDELSALLAEEARLEQLGLVRSGLGGTS